MTAAACQFRSRPTALRGKVDGDARVIEGVSVITRGEAIGHGLWIDEDFLEALASVNVGDGLKSRYTHPSMFGDGLGKFLGRVRDLRREGDRVIGDLYLAEAADLSPDGKLATYVMALAEEDPEAFGLSIVFGRDVDEEEAFVCGHEDEDGQFRSPDEMNVRGLRHARLDQVYQVDIVDDPAANPRGLFRAHRDTDTPEATPAQEKTMSQTPDAPKPATLAELKAKFGARPEFVLEQLEAGATLDQAELAHLRLEVAEAKRAEADALAAAETAKADAEKARREADQAASVTVTATSSGVDPINLSSGDEGDESAPGDFLADARRLAFAKDISVTEAMQRIARDGSGRFEAFVDAPRVMAGARRTVAWGSLQPVKRRD